MRFRIAPLIVLLVVVATLPGCGLFRKNVDYTSSKEGRPLEIPPDLDAPSTNNSLTIPAARTGAPEAAPDAAPASEVASATPAQPDPPAPVVAGEDSTMRLGDAVAGAWRRVGVALSRAGVGEVVASDESAGTYTLTGITQQKVPAQGNVVTRMFKRDTQTSVEATRTVRIVADGDGSLISVEDEQGQASSDEFARRIIAALKQRLG